MTKSQKYRKCNIISDSRSALDCICDPNSVHPIVSEIHTLIGEILLLGGEIRLFWIKAHAGISGNERADELAKQAALKSKTRPVYDRFPLSLPKRLIKENTLSTWQTRYAESTQGAVTKMYFPEVKQAYKVLRKLKITNSLAQIFTGHGAFRQYLHRFKLLDNPFCTCDNDSIQDTRHMFLECPRFGAMRYDYECRMDTNITVENLPSIVNDANSRELFLEYAQKILASIGIENGSKTVK
ncbi:hypothetical protein O0L34_g1979 [Tuta absoluta]|nr:hypothetical protein O0L34_g1979 [Tuta absoluta]